MTDVSNNLSIKNVNDILNKKKKKRRRRRKKKVEKVKKEPQMTNDELKELTKEEKRQELRKRLRDRIKNKKVNRNSKQDKNNDFRDHIQMLKDNNVNIENYLTQMCPDPKQRKNLKKKIKKIYEDTI